MTTKPLKRPRDPIALAKLIGDIATGQVEDKRKIERVSRPSKDDLAKLCIYPEFARSARSMEVELRPQPHSESLVRDSFADTQSKNQDGIRRRGATSSAR
jgi:hypothetical protein